ncbi:MAG: RRXRR domain-containing protein [Alphaproteobacteria bacterium]|nr:RRXRR domain-containing protein [Alphaproteobacteria bacterium]
MSLFVPDKRHKPLMPCSEKRARLLLQHGKAVVHRRFPFAIRLKEHAGADVHPVRLIDPGADETGVPIVLETNAGQAVPHRSETAHTLTNASRCASGCGSVRPIGAAGLARTCVTAPGGSTIAVVPRIGGRRRCARVSITPCRGVTGTVGSPR